MRRTKYWLRSHKVKERCCACPESDIHCESKLWILAVNRDLILSLCRQAIFLPVRYTSISIPWQRKIDLKRQLWFSITIACVANRIRVKESSFGVASCEWLLPILFPALSLISHRLLLLVVFVNIRASQSRFSGGYHVEFWLRSSRPEGGPRQVLSQGLSQLFSTHFAFLCSRVG